MLYTYHAKNLTRKIIRGDYTGESSKEIRTLNP